MLVDLLVENRLLRSNFIQQWLHSSSRILFCVVHQLFTASPAAWLHLIVIRCGIFLHLMGCSNNLFTDSCHALKEFGGEEMWIAFWYTWIGEEKKRVIKVGRKKTHHNLSWIELLLNTYIVYYLLNLYYYLHQLMRTSHLRYDTGANKLMYHFNIAQIN